MSRTSSYEYAALPSSGHIRLLRLHPGSAGSGLSGSTFPTSLADAPRYTCLSYAWGESIFSHRMTLDDQPFSITPSLASALRALRSPSDEKTFWIDAICINQRDIFEVNAQVEIMCDIFRKSFHVVVWLGEEADGSNRALAFLEVMGRDTDGNPDGSENPDMDDTQTSTRSSHHESKGAFISEAAPEAAMGSISEAVPEAVPIKELIRGPVRESAIDPAIDPAIEPAIEPVDKNIPALVDQRIKEPAEKSVEEPIEEPIKESVEEPVEDTTAAHGIQALETEQTSHDPPEATAERIRDPYEVEYAINEQRKGHIIFGFPVLYDMYPPHCEYMTDDYLADWRVVDALLARPWWSRTWVVQEVWHAPRAILRCGDATMDWRIFEKAMNYHEAWDDLGSQVMRTARAKDWTRLKRRYGLAMHISQKRLFGSKLSDLLWNTWGRESSDPRDKVFAILSLTSKENRPAGLVADYSKTMGQVFRETTRSIITHERSLDILLAASGISARDGLPTWVPDWRKEANDEKPTLFVNRNRYDVFYHGGSMDSVVVNGHGYCASGDSSPICEFDDTIDTIRVAAIIFDVVDIVARLDSKVEGAEAEGTEAESTEADGAKANGAGAADGVDAEHASVHAEATVDQIFQRALSTVRKSGKPSFLQLSDETLEEDVRRVLHAGWVKRYIDPDNVLRSVVTGRRFFITRNGHLGIGPANVSAGDTVYIIAGCNFPIVLRQLSASPETNALIDSYAVVGDAYVHGIMGGEAVGSSWRQIYIV